MSDADASFDASEHMWASVGDSFPDHISPQELSTAMTQERIPMKISDQIILHLINFGGFKEKYQVPFQASQAGVANILGAHRSHISYYLKKMESAGMLTSRLGRIEGLPRKRKVYFLTAKGDKKGREIIDNIIIEGIRWKTGEREIIIDIDELSFKNQKASFLEIVIKNVKKIVAEEEESSHAPLNYILDDPRGELHRAYRAMLTDRNRKMIRKAIDEGTVVLLSGDKCPDLVDAYLWTLASDISDICNVFVYDLHRFSTMEDLIYNFSIFLGKTGDYSLQRMIGDGTKMTLVWRKIARIVSGLPFVIMIRGEWSRRTKSELKKAFIKLADTDVPLIIAADDEDVSHWFEDQSQHISLKAIRKNVVEEIYGELCPAVDGGLSEPARKNLFREAVRSPLLLEVFSKEDDTIDGNTLLAGSGGFYASELEKSTEEELDILRAMSWMGYPLRRGQVKETVSNMLEQLARRHLLQTTLMGFRLASTLRYLLKKGTPDDTTRQRKAKELYEEMLFLSPYQALDAVALYQDTPELVDGLAMSCDWCTLTMERTKLPPLTSLFPDLNKESLSREGLSLYLTLDAFEKLYDGKTKKAERSGNEATRHGEQLKNEEVLARSYFLQGKISLAKGDYIMALERMVTSFNLFRGLDNAMGVSLSALMISEIFEHRAEPNKALAYIDMAVEQDKAMVCAPLISSVYAKRGELYYSKNIFAKASLCFDEASDMAARVGEVDKSLEYCLRKGDVLVEEGHVKEAVDVYEKTAEEAEYQGLGELQLRAYERLYQKCFEEGTPRYVRYRTKAGQFRVLLRGRRKKSRA